VASLPTCGTENEPDKVAAAGVAGNAVSNPRDMEETKVQPAGQVVVGSGEGPTAITGGAVRDASLELRPLVFPEMSEPAAPRSANEQSVVDRCADAAPDAPLQIAPPPQSPPFPARPVGATASSSLDSIDEAQESAVGGAAQMAVAPRGNRAERPLPRAQRDRRASHDFYHTFSS
jgi:hypothetical protein